MKNIRPFPCITGVYSEDITTLGKALAYVGVKRNGNMDRLAMINALMAMGFDGIEDDDPSKVPSKAPVRPVVVDLSAEKYVASLGITAILNYIKTDQIHLTVYDDINVVKKLTAFFGAPAVTKTWGGKTFTFSAPEGSVTVTSYDGYRGKQHGILLSNSMGVPASDIRSMAADIVAFWRTKDGKKFCKTAVEPFRATVDKLFPFWENMHGEKAVIDCDPAWYDEDAYNSLIFAVENLDI